MPRDIEQILRRLREQGLVAPREGGKDPKAPTGLPENKAQESRTNDGDPLQNSLPTDSLFTTGGITAGTGGGRIKR